MLNASPFSSFFFHLLTKSFLTNFLYLKNNLLGFTVLYTTPHFMEFPAQKKGKKTNSEEKELLKIIYKEIGLEKQQ